MKISVIITAHKEPDTIKNVVKTLENQIESLHEEHEFELILVAPDAETLSAGMQFDRLSILKTLKDEGKGKPEALNLAFKKSKGDILILSDGDVALAKDALRELIAKLKEDSENKYGAVTGRPIPLNSRDSMLGYWAWLTTQAGAHNTRLKRAEENQFILLSGYLTAVRKELLEQLPSDCLDDAYISYIISKKGKLITYAPNARVYVMFPRTLRDWIKQKKRNLMGGLQLKEMMKQDNMRGFKNEVASVSAALKYAENMRELFWTLLLFAARLCLWIISFWERYVKKTSVKDSWVRIESTKKL